MRKLFFTACSIAIFAMNSFAQNLTTGVLQQVQQYVPKSFDDNFCLVHTNSLTLKEANKTAEKIHEMGGRIAVIGSPEFMIGWLPAGVREAITKEKNIESVYTGSYNLRNEEESTASESLINYYNSVISGELFKNDRELSRNYFSSPVEDCLKHPVPESNESGRSICEKNKNSEYMKGSVSGAIFFVESNGAVDPNTYTWTSTIITNIKNQIIDAYSIWAYTASQNGVSLTFTPVWYHAPTSTVINQPYEPILHPISDDGLWMDAILGNLGYLSGDKFTDGNDYNWDLRITNGTNWAYSAFIIYNPSPAPSLFADGIPSYAYKGGPFTNLLYRAGSWPVNTFFRAIGHESAHIFNAFDEYSSSDPDNCTYSFNGVVNTNYEGAPCYGTHACVMIDNTYTGSGTTRQWNLCNPTKSHIGWQSLAPAPTLISPLNNAGVSPGTITFNWNRNTANANINSTLWVADTMGNIMDCSEMGTNTSAITYLPLGIYKWQIINGTDAWDGGYSEVSSPLYTLYVGMSGLEEISSDFSNDIFPNPATDRITIQNMPAGINLVEIYSMPGQKIFSEWVTQTQNEDYSINVEALPKGFYFVTITNKGISKAAKLLIQ